MSDEKFFDKVLKGKASVDEFPDYIEKWHGDKSTNLEVYDYLGLTWEEYKTVVLHQERFPIIIEARLRGEEL